MYIIPPAVVLAIAALFGAGAMVLLFRQIKNANWLAGAMIGAASATVGTAAVMVPLNFCTFENERSSLDIVFGAGLIVLAGGVALLAAQWFAEHYYSGRGLMPETDTRQGAFGGGYGAILTAAVFLLPTLIILLVFHYYPMLRTFELSTQLARLGAPRTVDICLDNFTRIAESSNYHQTVFISFGITAVIIFVGLSISLLIATMAHLPLKGARIYRILLVWPYALSPVIAGIVFRLLFNPTAGVVNHILDSLFGFEVEWLLDRNVAAFTVIAASIWNIIGFNILFYIAGLQNVPSDLNEAASIDGANALQRFFYVTFPLLSPITFFLVVTNTTYAFFDTFGLIDFLTEGGPSRATTTMMYDLYRTGIISNNLGRAASMSLVLFAVVIVVTVIQFRFSRDRVNYGV
jgi:sn-glycerol 3-phosphate transport system permease protein